MAISSKPNATSAKSNHAKQGARLAAAAGPLRVLMVEDVPTVAAAMRAALLQAGMDVETVATGTDALTAKDSFRPEIVLVDLELPDMNGIKLVEVFAREWRRRRSGGDL